MKKYKNKYRIESTRLQNWNYGWNGTYYVTICTKNKEHYFGEIKNNQLIPTKIGLLAQKFWDEIPRHFPNIYTGAFVVMPNHIHGIIVIDKPYSNLSNTVIDNNVVGGHDEVGISNIHDENMIGDGHDENMIGDGHDENMIGGGYDENVDGGGYDENMIGGGYDENVDGGGYVETRHCLVSTPPPPPPPHPTPPANKNQNPTKPQNRTIGQSRFQNQGKHTLSSIIGSYKSVVTKHARKINKNFGWQSRFYDSIIREKHGVRRVTNYINNNPKNWREDRFR